MQDQSISYRPKPDGDLDPAGEAGWYLQRERLRREETLAMAGETCGIHPHHLDAIETGDLTRLPARFEALRMIGDYGAYLGFDPQPLVLHYAQFLPKPMNGWHGRRRATPKPLGSAKIIAFPSLRALAPRSTGAIVSCLTAVALLGAAVWMAAAPSGPHSADDRQAMAEATGDILVPGAATTVGSITPITEAEPAPATAPLAGEDSVKAVPPPAVGEDIEAQEADRSVAELSGLAELISRELSAEKGGTMTAEASPAPDPPEAQASEPGRAYGSGNADARLILRAKAPVWVRIEDQQGNVVMTQTLLAGDSYRVPNRPDLVIIARDGGLLSFEIDGVAKGSLGAPGEILVGRPLNLESLGKQG